MKKCRACGVENADAMHFCVECGTPLAASPIVVDLQDSGTQRQDNPPPTVFAGARNTSGGQQNFAPNFPNPQTQKPKSYAKIFLILGGIFAVFLLLLMAGAAVVIFNLPTKKDVVVVNPTPMPSPVRIAEKKSPGPTPAASPSVTPDTKNTDEPPPKSDSAASAKFDKIWVDYNVTDKNRLGMRIHTNFTVYKMKNIDSEVAIYFQKDDDTKLLTNNKEFRSKEGQVAVYKALKPSYDETVYNDLQLFIPYTEFSLSSGKYNLKMDVDLIYENGELVQHLTYSNFEYEKP